MRKQNKYIKTNINDLINICRQHYSMKDSREHRNKIIKRKKEIN